MGDPKKIRKNYTRPAILWNESTLASDKEIRKLYRTKNKKEIWKMASFLQNIKDQTKSITSRLGTARKERALLEKDLLIAKVKRLGLIKKEEINLNDLLTLSLHDVMERRLQTIVHRKKLSRSVGQARQFIVHGHIRVADKTITSPSYLVLVEEEELIDFVGSSPLNDANHPERGDVDPNIVIKVKSEESNNKKAPDTTSTEDSDEKNESESSDKSEVEESKVVEEKDDKKTNAETDNDTDNNKKDEQSE